MKTAMVMILLACVCLFSTASALPTGPSQVLSERQTTAVRTSVMQNLGNPCCDLRVSTIQLVIELRDAYPDLDIDYAIIPLMNILKSDDISGLRILAACALNRFDSEKARFAVSRRALYDSDEHVARQCASIVRSWTDKSALGPAAIVEAGS